MEQATIKAGGPALHAARLPLWTVSLAVSIGYITVVTDDTYVVHVPLKLFLVAAAMGAWWWQIGRRRALRDYQLVVPVLLFAVAIPVAWALVAALRAAGGDPVGIHRFTWTMQECSRFVYLLLYFPLLDARRLYGRRGLDPWLLPVLALCLITVALFASHYLTGSPGDTVSFLVFKGVFEGNSGGFRVFIGNQVMFITATSLFLSELAASGPSRARVGALGLLIFSSYLSHTRGIWLGMSVVCAGVLVAVLWRDLDADRKRLLLGVVGGAVLLVVAVGVGMLAGAVPRPSFLGDTSAGLRVQQAPKLWDAFKQNPLVGDGLGAVIRPRFVRDPAAPWSYELTYLQLLFQMGAVGLIVVLALPLIAVRRGLRTAVEAELQAPALAGAMAILGILVASATNPYLMSSFGMLAMAIGLSLIAGPIPPSPGRVERIRAEGSG